MFEFVNNGNYWARKNKYYLLLTCCCAIQNGVVFIVVGAFLQSKRIIICDFAMTTREMVEFQNEQSEKRKKRKQNKAQRNVVFRFMPHLMFIISAFIGFLSKRNVRNINVFGAIKTLWHFSASAESWNESMWFIRMKCPTCT